MSEQDKQIKISTVAEFSSLRGLTREIENVTKAVAKLGESFNQIGLGSGKINAGVSAKVGAIKGAGSGGGSSLKPGFANPLVQSLVENKNALRSLAIDSKDTFRILTDGVRDSVSRQSDHVDKLKKKLTDLSATYDRLRSSGKLGEATEIQTRLGRTATEYTTANDSLKDLRKLEASTTPPPQSFMKRMFSEKLFNENGAVAQSGIGQLTGLGNLTKGGALVGAIAAAVSTAIGVGKAYTGEMIAQPWDAIKNRAALGGSYGGAALSVLQGNLKFGSALQDLLHDTRGRNTGLLDRPNGGRDAFFDVANNFGTRRAGTYLNQATLGNLLPENAIKSSLDVRRQIYGMNTEQKMDLLRMVQLQEQSNPMRYAHLDYLQENAGSINSFSQATGAGWHRFASPRYLPGETPGTYEEFKAKFPGGYLDDIQSENPNRMSDAELRAKYPGASQDAINSLQGNFEDQYLANPERAGAYRPSGEKQAGLARSGAINQFEAKKAGRDYYSSQHPYKESSPLEQYQSMLNAGYTQEEIGAAVRSMTPYLGRRLSNRHLGNIFAAQNSGIGNIGPTLGQALMGGDANYTAMYHRLSYLSRDTPRQSPNYDAFSSRIPTYGLFGPALTAFAGNVAGLYNHGGAFSSGLGATDIFAAMSQHQNVGNQLRLQNSIGPGIQAVNSILSGGPDALQKAVNMYSAIKALPGASYDNQNYLASHLNLTNLADILNRGELPEEYSNRGIGIENVRNYFNDIQKKMFNREIDENDESEQGKFKRTVRDKFGGSFSEYMKAYSQKKGLTGSDIEHQLKLASGAFVDWQYAPNDQTGVGIAQALYELGNVHFKGEGKVGGFADPSAGGAGRAYQALQNNYHLQMQQKIGEDAYSIRQQIKGAPALSELLSQASQNVNEKAADLAKSLAAFAKSLEGLVKASGGGNNRSFNAAAPR